MNQKNCLPFLLLAAGGLLPSAMHAQGQASTDAKTSDETITLSPFVISSAPAGRYQATEATSGTRVRVSLLDTTQSVSVVTRDLIDDIGAGRVLDAAKYVSGVYESTIPNAQDRTTIRGFQNDGATVDGFSYFSFANLDPVIVDRIEVVKGPNAILAPQGVPGGTLNNVSKKPVFSDRGYLSAQVGRYGSDRVELDVNRVVLPGKLAVRVVGAAQDADDYGDGNFHRSFIVMPMLTYRMGPQTQVTVQFEAYSWRSLNFGGIPISLYSGSNDKAHLLDGLPRDYILQHNDITRAQEAAQLRTFFTTSFTENLSMRAALNLINSHGSSVQTNIGAASNQVLTLDPNTGLSYWNGTTRNDSPLFPLGGNVNNQHRNYANFQNDFVYDLKTQAFNSMTVAGYAINYAATLHEKVQNYTLPTPQALPLATYTPYTLTNITGINSRYYRDQQVYVFERLSFLQDHLQVSGGLSRNWYFSENYDILNNKRLAAKPKAWLPTAGLVYKITNDIAAYYGFSKQATAINPSTTSTNFFDTQTSRQHEVGLRTQAFENRLFASLAYFNIKQNNFSVPNPLNSAVPSPSPALPPLFSNRLAHGVEFELRYAVTQNLSVVGNTSIMHNRDINGVPFRGTAEKSGALWLNYSFDKSSPVNGLTLGIGADYLSKRAGDTASGVTSASTPTNIIRIQPSFWLPERTLVNATVAYRVNKEWKAQLNVYNLFNEDYLQSSTSRTSVWPGEPINAKLTVTYSF